MAHTHTLGPLIYEASEVDWPGPVVHLPVAKASLKQIAAYFDIPRRTYSGDVAARCETVTVTIWMRWLG